MSKVSGGDWPRNLTPGIVQVTFKAILYSHDETHPAPFASLKRYPDDLSVRLEFLTLTKTRDIFCYQSRSSAPAASQGYEKQLQKPPNFIHLSKLEKPSTSTSNCS